MERKNKYLTDDEYVIIKYEFCKRKSLRAIAHIPNQSYSIIIIDVRKHGGKIYYMASRAINEEKRH